MESSAPASKGPSTLPPVQPPTAGFLLQLFLIPLIIVLIIVMVWLLFSWLAHMGSNPEDLVADIARQNDASWQRAYNLAELMRKPQYAHLKANHALAKELGDTLTSLRASRPERKKQAEAQGDDQRKKQADAVYENRLKLEFYICKILGEFTATDGLDALIAAGGPVEDSRAFLVRSGALQAIAVQAAHVDPKILQDNEALMEMLLAASRESSDDADKVEYDKLRTVAAYTLGMVGGDEALQRLAEMQDDPDPNARFNAALGLARYGDLRSLPVFEEMLDPTSEAAVADPEAPSEAARRAGEPWKRAMVLTNGIRAARQLMEKNPDADLSSLLTALEKLEQDPTNNAVRLAAKEARLEYEANRAKRPQGATP